MPRLGKKRRGINDMCSHVTDGVQFLYAGTRHGTIYGRKMVSGHVSFTELIRYKLVFRDRLEHILVNSLIKKASILAYHLI